MPYFVLAGISNCPLFNHAKYVTNFLSTHLPNFKTNILEMDATKWKKWLNQINLKNKWYHDKSVIIWKELTFRGGKPYLIGALSEFWEYCYDYYGLESRLSKDELKEISDDFQQYDKSKKITQISSKPKIVLIVAYNIQLTEMIIMELLQLDKIFGDGLIIRILNVSKNDANTSAFEDINSLTANFKYSVVIVDSLQVGLKNCELFIVTGQFGREINEDFYKWLDRNYFFMMELSENINLYAKYILRIILAMDGPVCFNASILLETVTKVSLHNIVAITANLGLEVLSTVSKLTNIPLEDLGAPPVWGFIGVNQLIDIEHTIQKCNVYRPNSRALKEIHDTTLPLGKNVAELRFICYAINNIENLWSTIYKEKENGGPSNFAKVRAIVSLLENWYFTEELGNIISLGIISNGTFGIPKGIAFSQPVYLKNGRWVPADMFPCPRKDPCDIKDFIPLIKDIFKYFKFRVEHDF